MFGGNGRIITVSHTYNDTGTGTHESASTEKSPYRKTHLLCPSQRFCDGMRDDEGHDRGHEGDACHVFNLVKVVTSSLAHELFSLRS